MSKLRAEISIVGMKIRKSRADRAVSGLHLRRCIFGFSLFSLVTLCLCGCGSHYCAICGQSAKERVLIGEKEFHICESCYGIYFEEEHLFEKEP